ncbi:MAG: ADP-ribose-binding protein [Phycisphaerae bacterium]
MTEKACNLWLEPAEYRCILTSGALSPDGTAILDDPTALEAAKRFQGLEQDLGRLIAARGNHVHLVGNGLVTFPVKQFQFAKPTLAFIQRSAKELAELVGGAKTLLPRPGCRPGEMTWETVAPALAGLPDNIIVIQHT